MKQGVMGAEVGKSSLISSFREEWIETSISAKSIKICLSLISSFREEWIETLGHGPIICNLMFNLFF
ncbi:hypothetical protein LEP1GSC072_1392 [Leptospira noguchii str. Bonito]|nr:hypothetical protein LEP1GSC072_1392 [Leptospira noguchii str. Bonito]